MAVLLVMAFVFVCTVPAARAEQRMRVALDIRNSVVTTPTVVASALREASNIWAPYGVAIERAGRTRESAEVEGTTVVPVTLESARARGQLKPRGAPLGWTGFSRTGQPMMRISIFYDTIALVANGGMLFGVREMQAAIVHERLVARVLGRTLAHEVGHVILSSPDHSLSGLMRAAQPVPELQHPSTDGFALEEGDIARLRRILERARVATATQP